jgi:hypothetical protein
MVSKSQITDLYVHILECDLVHHLDEQHILIARFLTSIGSDMLLIDWHHLMLPTERSNYCQTRARQSIMLVPHDPSLSRMRTTHCESSITAISLKISITDL